MTRSEMMLQSDRESQPALTSPRSLVFVWERNGVKGSDILYRLPIHCFLVTGRIDLDYEHENAYLQD